MRRINPVSNLKSKGISADERRYQAEDDARTMKRYAELTGDNRRVKAAQGILRKELKQTQAVLSRAGGKRK
jgi:hypothetical protein